MTLLLNCDLGELEDAHQRVEHGIMPLIDLANVACGFHAGSPLTMRNTLAIAGEYRVSVGAHPGYRDRANFGRVSVPHTPGELAALLHYQISALAGMAANRGLSLDYVKPHGALYNDMMGDGEILATVLGALAEHRGPKTLMLLATRDAETHREIAARHGISLIFEAFADRRYTDKGHLAPRCQPGALLTGEAMLDQVRQLCEDGTVTTLGGQTLQIDADTLCVHGDTPDALAAATAIRGIVGPAAAED